MIFYSNIVLTIFPKQKLIATKENSNHKKWIFSFISINGVLFDVGLAKLPKDNHFSLLMLILYQVWSKSDANCRSYTAIVWENVQANNIAMKTVHLQS